MSHYIAIKYYRKYYLYARDAELSHKKALDNACYLAADLFKHVYNSSQPVLTIKSDIKKNALKTIYQTYDEYLLATKDIPLGDKYYL